MPTKTIPYSGTIYMRSQWKCAPKIYKPNQTQKDYIEGKGYVYEVKRPEAKCIIISGPTLSVTTISFNYSFTSGSKIKAVTFWANISAYKASILTANDSSFTKKKDGQNGAPLSGINLNGTGTLNVTLRFRAAGSTDKEGDQYAGATFSDIYLEIEYEGETTEEAQTSAPSGGLAVPPQSVCIYDEQDGSIYLFDGVLKVQHSLTMDIQEEKSGDKNGQYVNNAKNEPDKLSLDIIMSDVYSGGGSILSANGKTTKAMQNAIEKTGKSLIQGYNGRTRSELAYYTLHWLKEERRKLSVLTPQYVYTEMILSTVTVNHEDSTPFGWEGQLVFQHAYKKKDDKKQTSKASDGAGIPSMSVIASWIHGGE